MDDSSNELQAIPWPTDPLFVRLPCSSLTVESWIGELSNRFDEGKFAVFEADDDLPDWPRRGRLLRL